MEQGQTPPVSMTVTGGSSGLGKAIIDAALDSHQFDEIYCIAKEGIHRRVRSIICDVSDPVQVMEAEVGFPDMFGTDVLVNCAGINRIGWLEDFPSQTWDEVMDTNAKSIFLMSRSFVHVGGEGLHRTILNIVSNASHMPMTGSLAYNASKGAAHIMTLQLARELMSTHGITVFGLSPAKMSGTQMSEYIDGVVPGMRGWSEQYAREYQLKNLLLGEEIEPELPAELIVWLLSKYSRHKHLAGCIIPYGA